MLNNPIGCVGSVQRVFFLFIEFPYIHFTFKVIIGYFVVDSNTLCMLCGLQTYFKFRNKHLFNQCGQSVVYYYCIVCVRIRLEMYSHKYLMKN